MKAEELLTAFRVIGPVLVTDRTTGLDYLALAINGVKATVIPVIVGETENGVTQLEIREEHRLLAQIATSQIGENEETTAFRG